MSDLQKAFRKELYDLLTGDAKLKTLLSNPVRLYHVWAEKNAKLPYLVYRIASEGTDVLALGRGVLYLDAWDHSRSTDRLASVRGRLIELLEERTFCLTEGRFDLYSGTDGFTPEPDDEIKHWSSVWSLRYTRLGEVNRVAGR